MTKYEIFYERDRNIENLSHFHGTRTSTLSWMHAKRTPDGGRKKRMSNSTFFLNGLGRSVMCLNAESDDLNILSTPDTSPFLVTLMLSQSFPVSMRTSRLSSKLLRQGYVMERLKSSLRKFYGRYGDLIKHYEVSLSQMLHDILGHDHIQWHPQLIRHYTYLRIYYRTGL